MTAPEFAPLGMLPQSDDALLQAIALGAPRVCRAWAQARFVTDTVDIELYPRDRGDIHRQVPYRITQRIVEKGIWRILLCPEVEMPAGVPLATRDSLHQAVIIARSPLYLTSSAWDHLIQCGLFGEVLYPCS